jgi:hypothetical protein
MSSSPRSSLPGHCSVLGLDLKSSDHDVVIAQISQAATGHGAPGQEPLHPLRHIMRTREGLGVAEDVSSRLPSARSSAGSALMVLLEPSPSAFDFRIPSQPPNFVRMQHEIPRSEYGYAPEIGDRSTWFAHAQGGLLNMGSVCACLDASGHFIQLVVPQLSVSASELRGVVSLAHDLSPSNQRGSSNRWWGHTGSTLCGAVYFNVLEDFPLSGSF